MAKMMSVCGVMCADCPAYLGGAKGLRHQKKTAAAWKRIYGLNEPAPNISCGGCLGPDGEVFHTSRNCKARSCALAKGYKSCAECPIASCPDLEKAQSVWDGVPELSETLSRTDFVAYAQPYCGHRRRLARARAARGR
jgi:hypothetical protein